MVWKRVSGVFLIAPAQLSSELDESGLGLQGKPYVFQVRLHVSFFREFCILRAGDRRGTHGHLLLVFLQAPAAWPAANIQPPAIHT